MNPNKGFTLIELLIVIGILAILSVFLILVLNPVVLITASRDGVRVNDIANINEIIHIYKVRTNSIGGSAQTVYVSLPDSSPVCANHALPKLPTGWTYSCKSQTDYRKMNGTGWIPVNFALSDIQGMSVLPVDPINTATSGYFAYVVDPVSNTWVITVLLASDKSLKEIARKDGGTDDARYEVGTNLALWVEASGLTAYWPFDEGTGSIAYDASGHGHSATPPVGKTFPTWVDGIFNKGLNFTATTHLLESSFPAFDSIPSDSFSIVAWVKPQDVDNRQKIIFKGNSLFGMSVHDNGVGSDERGIAWQVQIGGTGWGGNTTSFFDNNYNEWAHFVLTSDKDNTSFKAYLNGNLMANPPPTGGIGEMFSDPISIGDPVTDPRNQIIDEARIYNRELGAQEISGMYRAGK